MATTGSYDVYLLSGSGTSSSPFVVAAGDAADLYSVGITETREISADAFDGVAFDTFTESSATLGTLIYVGFVGYSPAPTTASGPSPRFVTAAVGRTDEGEYYMFVETGVSALPGDGETHCFTAAPSSKPRSQWELPVAAAPLCFVEGTLVRTVSGACAVDKLRIGDLVLTADGCEKAIKWIGSTVVASKFADPVRSWPIRIKAGALAENTPSRDLLLSPGHAVLVEDVLVHAAALVNGVSVVRETEMPMMFSYYDVEVDTHVLLIAENTPSESFLEAEAETRLDRFPDRAALAGQVPHTEMPFPRVKTPRQLPQNVRAALDARLPLFAGVGLTAAA